MSNPPRMSEWHEVKPIPERERGIYRKYKVTRYRDPDGKHDNCEYFVLDWKHDPYAIAAARAYADACEKEHPVLANELRIQADFWEDARRAF